MINAERHFRRSRGFPDAAARQCRLVRDNQPVARPFCGAAIDLASFTVILSRTGAGQIHLLGGSWGSVICGKFVAEGGASRVRRLVLYAPLYSEPSRRPAWLGDVPSPDLPEDLANQIGAYRRVSGDEIRARWNSEIPAHDKSSWRADGMLEALVASCIADENEAAGFKVPNGTLVDLHCIFKGRPLYESRDIRVPTLLIRGSADPTSTNGDACRLLESLGSPVKRYVVVGKGAHFMIAEHKIGEVHAGGCRVSVGGFAGCRCALRITVICRSRGCGREPSQSGSPHILSKGMCCGNQLNPTPLADMWASTRKP
jgi:pimeloyl-ACP methyl ester carboxylesterase